MIESTKTLIDARNRKVTSFLVAFYFLYTYIEPYIVNITGSVGAYIILFVITGLILFSRHFHFKSYHFAIIGWLLYKFFSLLWTTDYAIFEAQYLTHIGIISLLIFITATEDGGIRFSTSVKSIWAGSAIIGLLSLFMSKPYEGIDNRQVLTLFNHQIDPNNHASFLLYGVAISLYCLLYKKEHRWLHIIVLSINSYTTLITGSRGALLSIGAIVLGYILTIYDKDTLKTTNKKIFVFAIIVVFTAIVILNLLPTDIFERLFNFESYEGGNNRDIMWRHGLSVLSSPITLIMGAGWGSYKTNGFSSLHNTFLSMLCDVGLIGFSLLFAPTLKAAFSMAKKRNPLPLSVLIAGMAPAFFFESINKRAFWNAIIFVFIAYNHFLNEKEAENTAAKKHSKYVKN